MTEKVETETEEVIEPGLGDTGIATHLHYNKETGRMKEIDNPYEVDYNAEDNTEEVPF